MRLNRKIRIGAAIVALVLFILGLVTITRRMQPSVRPVPIASSTGAASGNTVAAPASTSRIAVARENIPERSIVTPDMLVMRDAPAGLDARAFVTDPSAQAVGFVTARPITAGLDVRRADFLGHISDVGIAGALLPGRRAMIIPIGNKSTLHDLVRIGDRIDIVASFDQQESRTVAEDVRVLAVDVFGSDYPQVKIAMRGDYKAPAHSYSAAVPPSPVSSAQTSTRQGASGGASPDAPAGQQPAGAAPAGAAGPNPTPTQGPPPARPEASLTIEVTPQQATDIALTQAAGQNLDFLLRPRSEPGVASGTTGVIGSPGASGVTLASGQARSAAFSTRERLAPYAARAKRAPSAVAVSTRNSARSARANADTNESRPARRGNSRLGGSSIYTPPSIPDVPPPARDIPPANLGGATRIDAPSAPQPPATYDIPIYGDGKLVRTDTVRRPPANQ